MDKFEKFYGRKFGIILEKSDEENKRRVRACEKVTEPGNATQTVNPITGKPYSYPRDPIAFSFSTGGMSGVHLIHSNHDERVALQTTLAEMDIASGGSPVEYWKYCSAEILRRTPIRFGVDFIRPKVMYLQY